MSRRGACSEHVLTGACSRADCRFSHDLSLFCRPCSESSSKPFFAHRHLQSKEHKAMAKKVAAYCQLCLEELKENWTNHCQSTRHRDAASRAPEWFDAPFPFYKDITEPAADCVRCLICHVDVLQEEWEQHVSVGAHRVKWVLTVPTKRVVERRRRRQPSQPVAVSHEEGVDFGIVDCGAKGVIKGLTLTAQARLQIQSARITSTIEGRTEVQSSLFSSSIRPRTLKKGEKVSVNVTFKPANDVGAFDDRIEVQFVDTRSNHQFVVCRSLHAEVGERRILEALRPKSEYVQSAKVYAVVEEEPMETLGTRWEDPFKVRWAGRLPDFKIPKDLATALKGDKRGLVNAIDKQFMPPKPLTLETYAKYWQVLLHVEEAQQTADLMRYSLEDVKLSKAGRLYELPVSGLAEKRPSVVVGDLIKIKLHDRNTSVIHGGFVHKVRQSSVKVSLDYKFPFLPGLSYDVDFTLNRMPMRRQHQAVLSQIPRKERLLFPTWDHLAGAQPGSEYANFTPYNRSVGRNGPQKAAVDRILKMKPGSPPFLVYGPFGTGKTTTLVEAIKQLRFQDDTIRILACAPSNAAADAIAVRLKDLGSSTLLRLNSPTREWEGLTPDMKAFHGEFSLTGEVEEDGKIGTRFRIPEKDELMEYSVVVATCVSGGVPTGLGVPRGFYHWVFVDEAGQASEPEAMIPVLTGADQDTNVVLCGDPRQLQPIIHSPISKALGHAVSLMDRLMNLEMYDDKGTKGQSGLTVVQLRHNFRNHPSILQFPNEKLYAGQLLASALPMLTQKLSAWDTLPNSNFPIMFKGVVGQDKREGFSPSYFNPHEVLIVRNYVDDLLKARKLGIKAKDIGIIAPYSAQCSKLRQIMSGSVYSEVKIGSVEEFQGQERTVIILSTTRSSPDHLVYDLRHTLGFVASPRRLNVAITRAQAGLIVVGNPKVLSIDPLWRSFINFIHINGGYVGPKLDWNTTAEVNFEVQGIYAQSRALEAMTRMDALERRIRGLVLSSQDEEAYEEEEDQILYVSRFENAVGWRDDI